MKMGVPGRRRPGGGLDQGVQAPDLRSEPQLLHSVQRMTCPLTVPDLCEDVQQMREGPLGVGFT